MRKTAKYGIAFLLLWGLMAACCVSSISVTAEEALTEENNLSESINEDVEETEKYDLSEVKTIDEISEIVGQDVEETVDDITDEYDIIKETLSDFDAYQANPSLTEDFYNKIMTETDALSIRLREYALKYAEIIIESDADFGDKYDDLEDIYDEIYDDASGEIYDEIYDKLFDDMYDDIYDGIIDDAYDTVAYDTWDDARSAEYSMWDDARSEVYTSYDNARSDIYTFYDKIRSHTYKKSVEKISRDIEKFQRKINKLRGIEVEEPIQIDLASLDLSTVTTPEEMDGVVDADVETTISVLYSELKTLQTELGSYEKYKENSSKTEEFYDHVTEEMEKASGRLRGYALRYAEIIVGSGLAYDDQYDELSDITDAIYTDAGSTLIHEIYSGLLKECMKYFYDDVLKSGYDSAPYSEVSSFRSDEYSNASDARSDVYSEISDLRSDVYDFTSDIRSAVWEKDSEKVNKELEKFRKKTEKYNQ